MINPNRSDEQKLTRGAPRLADRPACEKVYVKVTSDFDTTGYMQPRIITWSNGQSYRIDRVKDFRPAASMGARHSGDCYTVVIRGEERHLFFERADPLFTSRLGRWFIEVQPRPNDREPHPGA